MARQSQYRSVRTPPRERRILMMVTVFIIFLVFADFVTGGIVRSALHRAVAVFSRSASGVGEVIGTDVFSSKSKLQSKVDSLEAELAAYRARDSAYKAVQDENEALKKMVHFADEGPGITAPVLLSFSASPYGTFMIGTGSAGGVREGAIVRAADGYAVGTVVEADMQTAIVKEFFAPSEKVEVTIGSAAVTLEGYGGGNARGQAAREAVIAEGDIALSPAHKGLPVGVVGKVVADPANSFTQVYVRLPENLAELKFVYVQQNGK